MASTIVSVVVFALTIGLLALCIWVLICNSRAVHQRMRLFYYYSATNKPNWFWREWAAPDAPSYYDHVWALVRLKNPKLLYGPGLQGIWPLVNG